MGVDGVEKTSSDALGWRVCETPLVSIDLRLKVGEVAGEFYVGKSMLKKYKRGLILQTMTLPCREGF